MRRGWRWLMVLGLLAGLVPLLPVGVVVADDAVVMAPCDDDAFDAALATALTNGGGTITFNCGGPVTINVDNHQDDHGPQHGHHRRGGPGHLRWRRCDPLIQRHCRSDAGVAQPRDQQCERCL